MSTAAANEEVQATEINTSQLKSFAQAARRQLLEQVEGRLQQVLAEGSLARRENETAVEELEKQIAAASREQVIERVAYTWFNRFCALRFMDANRYTNLGTVSPAEGYSQPEILADAKQGVIDADWGVDQAQVLGLLDGSLPSTSPEQEAYRLLLVAVCNRFHAYMPFMFEKIADYTELLLPGDLLSENSVLTQTCQVLSADACQNVEVIGWLYQFYISEKKDDVFAALKKGKKITPENIPAATQLFTPHWIVRYLVENSLGRLWMLNNPDSKLIDQMDYYIKPEEPETDFLKISSPEEIKICDPACGSGHMLTYAFDLLYAIYQEQGYTASDIPRLILENNLYGIEIDGRAGALAAFALTMKAREKYRRFLTGGKVAEPNVCVLENISIDPEDLSAYMDKVGRDLFTDGLVGVVNQWEQADNFGSLIRPLVQDVSTLLDILDDHNLGNDLFHFSTHEKVLTALRQADYLSAKYHVVVTNPPYMGSRQMNAKLKAFGKKQFSDSKSDLFAMFVERGFDLATEGGLNAMVTMQTWMFLSSYKTLRERLLEDRTILALVHMGNNVMGIAFGTSATVWSCRKVPKYGGHFSYVDNDDLNGQGVPREFPIRNDRLRIARATDFAKVPGRPIAYWISDRFRDIFDRAKPLEEIAPPKLGMHTTDNNRFLRLWYEVSTNRIERHASDSTGAVASGKKWFPYDKGGEFRKWYGNNDFLLNYFNDGEELKELVKEKYRTADYAKDFTKERWDRLIEVWVLTNRDFFFLEGVTWSFVSASKFGVRHSEAGHIFDVGGSKAFPSKDNLFTVMGFLCSRFAFDTLRVVNSSVNFQVGDIGMLPWLTDEIAEAKSEIDEVVREAVEIAKTDCVDAEDSYQFQNHPLVRLNQVDLLAESWSQLHTAFRERSARMRQIEERNNELFIRAYGLDSEMSSTVENSEVTLNCNSHYRYGSDKSESELEALLLADTMREFISYAVGCMLGRYSLDKPGLILANAGETIDDYLAKIPEPTFMPDDDNVIPLLDGDWFTDDITGRLKEFLKVTFGTDNYEENLTFLENSIYPENLKGKKRKSIRDYFLKEFYNHHIKLYKKRPIYWLFSSPKGTFNALIYLHRYRSDTVSVVLSYLRDFQAKLTAQMEHLQRVADSGGSSQKEKAKALKEINNLKKELKEIEDYERDTLYPLATAQVELDLDDGVKVNYNKLGKALKKVTGLSGM